MSDIRKVHLDVPSWSSERGAPVEFEDGALLNARVDSGATVIEGNAAGFRSLAKLCLTLSADGVPYGTHVHLAPGLLVAVPPASSELIIERIERV